jgi:AraC family transcriptional regulator
MEASSPAVARITWAHAKLAHYAPVSGCADATYREFDPSLTDPSSVSFAFFGGFEAVVATAGVTSRRTIVPGGITLCGPEPIKWLGGTGSGAGDFIEITATRSFRRELAEELGVPDHYDLDYSHGWRDPVVWAIASRFRSAARQTIFLDDLEQDLLLRRLYGRVLERRFGGRDSTRGSGGLDAVRLTRILDFIQDHLNERLTVARLAEAAALSSFHFVRAFQQSVGLTPHKYVRARRLERARELLASGVRPRTVAERTGYESLSHFRGAYRTHFGVHSERDPSIVGRRRKPL